MQSIGKSTRVIFVIVALISAAMVFARLNDETTAERVDVTVPTLSAIASEGQQLFANNCTQCHGNNGSGSNMGPPLIHLIYNSGHHADLAFHFAVERGVQQHHWHFGAMPRQPQVSQLDIEKIVRFVREVQAANGIIDEGQQM